MQTVFKTIIALLGATVVSGSAYAEDVAQGNGVSGDVSIGTSYENWGGYHDNSQLYGSADIRLQIPVTGAFTAQFDGSFHRAFDITSAGDASIYQSLGHVGAHLLYRGDGYQLGVMAGAGASSVDGSEGWHGTMVGVEAQKYLGNVTLWGQVGHVWQDEDSSEAIRANAVRGGVRYFIEPTLRLDVEAGYAAGTFDGYNAKVTTWGLGVEKLISQGANADVSVFARYEGAHLDFSDYGSGDELTKQAVKVGFSLKFGHKGLLEQDRSGVNTDMNFSGLSILDATY